MFGTKYHHELPFFGFVRQTEFIRRIKWRQQETDASIARRPADLKLAVSTSVVDRPTRAVLINRRVVDFIKFPSRREIAWAPESDLNQPASSLPDISRTPACAIG